MKRSSKALGVVLAVTMAIGTAGCTNSDTIESPSSASPGVSSAAPQGYTFGEGTTFRSNDPVTYSIMFSDQPTYPYKKDWRLWSAIQEKTNVSFDVNVIPATEYENKKSLLVNSGDAPFIIPKTYDESSYVASGQIVPISDWVQYMPNYQKAVKAWGMDKDLRQKLKSDGKYYVLPGLWEVAGGGYSYMIRKDIFEKAGIDVKGLEGKWTYEDFYEALKKVKAYTGAKYVMSDEFNGKSTLNITAAQYGVTGGWGIANGTRFNEQTKQFEFAESTNDFKDYVTYLNKLVKEGLLDPESFTQDDKTAQAKFYKGDTYVMNANYQILADSKTKMQVPDADLYMIVQPGGPKGMLQIETSRLENGVMISQNALKKLGKDKFIEMLRFVDWLWYSDEGQMLSLWGVEGETYTKDANGNITLNPDISFNGMNSKATKKLNVDFGFGGGNFAYGGSAKLKMSKMTEGEKDYNNRIQTLRKPRMLAPPIMGNPDESEQMNLISKPLMDYVDTMTLKFITGQANIGTDWNTYVTQVESIGASRYMKMANDIFNKTKGMLGY
ncbi:sugar ABC transporter substrate-binding protein [Paenibacillus sp. GCM10027628]|uniref:ABC transporter substrate-binding protein n=1 Tax=Paenibacillus sp. GCM10027628 TaxID=3273413 RepID=UPI003633FCB5